MISAHLLADAAMVIGSLFALLAIKRLSDGPKNPNKIDGLMYSEEQYIYQEDGKPLMRRGTDD